MIPSRPEEVLRLGPERTLVAIWTPPALTPVGLNVLFVNAGVIHHIGPHRLHVKLARMLAVQGLGCARLDLSGVGDSPPARNGADFRSQAVADIRAVMDELAERTQIHSFVLVGICSGAAHSQAVALLDERVKGVFLVDGYMYATWRAPLYFLTRMFRTYGFRQASQRLLKALRARWTHERPSDLSGMVAAPEPRRTAEEFAQDMQTLVQRHVRVCLMFTGSVLEVFAHPDQLHHRFGRARWIDQVQTLFEPTVDHTLTLHASQSRLSERLSAWLATVAPTPPRQS